jgi:hypothetical protein
MRNMQRSMPVLVLIGATMALIGLAWLEQRDTGAAVSAAGLRLIDAAAEAATDTQADAYMPGVFK